MTPVSNGPRISVVIPARNMGKYLGAAIESIFAQTYPAHEVIVVDDGSTDETLTVLSQFDARVRVMHGPGKGSAIARNLGILASTGDHIAFLDADDLWMPTKLQQQIALLSEERGFIFTDYYRAENPLEPGTPLLPSYKNVSEGQVFSDLLRENFISTPSVLVRKDVLARAGLFKASLIGGQDYDLWLRLAKHTQFGWVREPVVFMRKHGGNITGSAAYPYYHAKVWEEILREHVECKLKDRDYIRWHYGFSLYEAGRHAMRQFDLPKARHYFWEALKCGPYRLLSVLWSLISRLPRPILRALLAFRQKNGR